MRSSNAPRDPRRAPRECLLVIVPEGERETLTATTLTATKNTNNNNKNINSNNKNINNNKEH